MKDKNLLGPWIRRFLLEHLVAERNLSRNTQASYRDTLTLLLPFASKHSSATSWITCSVIVSAARLPATNVWRPSIHLRALSAYVRRPTWPGVPRYVQYRSRRQPKPWSGISRRPRWTPL